MSLKEKELKGGKMRHEEKTKLVQKKKEKKVASSAKVKVKFRVCNIIREECATIP